MNCFIFIAPEPEWSERSVATKANALSKHELLHVCSFGTGTVGTKWSREGESVK
ncbi:hypothetical protein [Sulfurovum lithotrophicum]|uniref:hypothetical protein n=1 Tax=Sulfurovum lithotrophicum TaxID=206403 RepID=UPI0012B6E3A2|nr:hypothetical protein [Sulfurovum lithotrophicum]